ncbi:hypothetical protein Tco_0877527, partial [Tanacetum coccineum]
VIDMPEHMCVGEFLPPYYISQLEDSIIISGSFSFGDFHILYAWDLQVDDGEVSSYRQLFTIPYPAEHELELLGFNKDKQPIVEAAIFQQWHQSLQVFNPSFQTFQNVGVEANRAFACRCGSGDVVLRESYQPKTHGKLYYACPLSKPCKNYFGCEFFIWKEERVRLLISSPGASSTLSFSPGTSSTPIFSPGPSTPPIYSSGSLRNGDCSNCKLLLARIKLLEVQLKMYMHPEQHTLNSTALLHEVYNDMGKFGFE